MNYDLLTAAGISENEITLLTGIARPTVRRYLTGGVTKPAKSEKLEKLGKAMQFAVVHKTLPIGKIWHEPSADRRKRVLTAIGAGIAAEKVVRARVLLAQVDGLTREFPEG